LELCHGTICLETRKEKQHFATISSCLKYSFLIGSIFSDCSVCRPICGIERESERHNLTSDSVGLDEFTCSRKHLWMFAAFAVWKNTPQEVAILFL
jgi:hypothetical protein